MSVKGASDVEGVRKKKNSEIGEKQKCGSIVEGKQRKYFKRGGHSVQCYWKVSWTVEEFINNALGIKT